MTEPMHADEVDTDADLVRRLLRAQHPQWADLPIERLASDGTDHAIYRLGEELAARLPRIHWAAGQVASERRWLPVLAPLLPLRLPVPVASGAPGAGYPFEWCVSPWIEGERLTAATVADPLEAVDTLVGFIRALQAVEPSGGPVPRGRGGPLAERDEAVRKSIAAMGTSVDPAAVTAAWDADRRAPVWEGPGVWIHGDLSTGNVLAQEGRVLAVIDWGTACVGDPACELHAAWNLFSGEHRMAFRSALAVDDATWARARAWALSVALLYIPYYEHTYPPGVALARQTVARVLADHEGAG